MPDERARSFRVMLGDLTTRLTNFAEPLEGDLSTWSVLLVLFAGILFGAIVLFVDAAWWDTRHRHFAGKGPFVLWAGLMCAQTALWALALAWLLPSVKRLRVRYGDKNRNEVVRSTLIILAIILLVALGGPFLSRWPDYVTNHVAKVALLTGRCARRPRCRSRLLVRPWRAQTAGR